MKQITLYTTKTCAFCKNVKDYLKHKNREYTLKDVTDDPETRIWLYKKTGYTTVPILQVDDKFVVGVQYGKMAELLG